MNKKCNKYVYVSTQLNNVCRQLKKEYLMKKIKQVYVQTLIIISNFRSYHLIKFFEVFPDFRGINLSRKCVIVKDRIEPISDE